MRRAIPGTITVPAAGTGSSLLRADNSAYRRVTVTALDPMFPPASCDRIMIVVVPIYTGIGPVDQFAVPAAMPLFPVEVAQVTSVTPRLSVDVPAIVMLV